MILILHKFKKTGKMLNPLDVCIFSLLLHDYSFPALEWGRIIVMIFKAWKREKHVCILSISDLSNRIRVWSRRWNFLAKDDCNRLIGMKSGFVPVNLPTRLCHKNHHVWNYFILLAVVTKLMSNQVSDLSCLVYFTKEIINCWTAFHQFIR